MQELSLEQMKLVSGGADSGIPRVTIDGGSSSGWGAAATSVGFGSYSSPSIGGGGGGGVGSVAGKLAEIVVTVVVEKVVETVIDKAMEPAKPDPAKAAQEAAAAEAARQAKHARMLLNALEMRQAIAKQPEITRWLMSAQKTYCPQPKLLWRRF